MHDMSQYQDSHLVDDEMQEADAMPEDELAGRTSGRASKRASAAAEDNDAELRRLATENQDVELEELARRVRNDENSPSAEKTRQVYGLGWYTHSSRFITALADTASKVDAQLRTRP